MKKIIYSLVIMIAAGSLFTSCVENTEPQGIKDLREAKADYLASLSKLREADAEKVKAEATLVQAQAETEQARAALKQAFVEAQKLANEAKSIKNDVEAAKAQASIDSIKAAAEKAAVVAEEALAKAQAQLDSTLRAIVAASIGLNKDERDAIVAKTDSLNNAYGRYNTALGEYNFVEALLWDAEYNVAAGFKGYETAESFQDSIAKRESLIADANARIATYEALKIEPSEIKDTLDAIDLRIHDIDVDILNNQNAKNLYEASIFVEAKREYTKRWDKFVEDSIGTVEPFKFVDEDEYGNDVPKAYELTDGKKVDDIFGSLINNDWEESRKMDEYSRYSDIFNLNYYGFNYNTEKNAVEVGFIEGRYWRDYATPEHLTEGLDVLDKIVETLNRDMVVVDNLADSITVDEAKKAADKAWKAYTTDRDTLEGGLKDYKPYKDSLAQIAKLAEDTVKAKKAHDDAEAELKTVNTENTKKEAAQIEAVKTTAAAYESAVKKLAAEIATYGNLKVAKTADSTKFIAAINAFGEAQAAFLGHQDSVKYEKGFDPETGHAVKHTDPISQLNIDYFRPNKEGKAVYTFGLVAVVAKICNNQKTGDDVWKLTEKELLAAVENPLPKKGEGKTAKDSIEAVKTNPAVAAAIKAFNDYQAVVKKAEHDADSTAKDFSDAKSKLADYHGEDDAIAAYKDVYKRFWGVNDWKDIEKDTAATKFSWTDKTFLEPTNCVKFWCEYYDILPSSTLETILKNVDPEGYWNQQEQRAQYHTIFRSNEWNWTEFAQALIAAQKVEDLGDYVPNKARLEKINAQVAQIREDVEAAIAEYEAATEGLEEVYARFYGVDEDGNLLSAVRDLAYATIVEGKWALGGYQLAWAEELAPEYPEIYEDVTKANVTLNQKRNDLVTFQAALNTAYTAWAKLQDPTLAGASTVKDIIDYFDWQIGIEEQNIEQLEAQIVWLEKAVAACEAGYSPAEVKVDFLKALLAQKKVVLEQAAEALARAKAEYDAVIALYGVNE